MGKLIKHEGADGDAGLNGWASHAQDRHDSAQMNAQASPGMGLEQGGTLSADRPPALPCRMHACESTKTEASHAEGGEDGEGGGSGGGGHVRDQQVRKRVAMFAGKEGPAAGLLEDALVVAVGSKCMAYDPRDDKWYKSSIVELKGDKAKIHYDGWGRRFDTWCLCVCVCVLGAVLVCLALCVCLARCRLVWCGVVFGAVCCRSHLLSWHAAWSCTRAQLPLPRCTRT